MENVEETHVEGKNLVGIIPIAGREDYDFNMPWPNCMMPIAADYSLIEASVVECAWAGCKSIYIVVNDDYAPIIRKRIGDWCGDPVWAFRKFDPIPHESKRRIPIFYIPIHPKDRMRRDCLSWSVIHGALTAFKLTSKISKWMRPSKYYVSFPHGYFDPKQLREHRKVIAGPTNCYISFNGESVKNGHFTSFTFFKEDWIKFRRIVRAGTGIKVPGSKLDNPELLPAEERWSATRFGVDKVFAPLDLEESYQIEVQNFWNIRSWEEYSDFIASTRTTIIRKPKKTILFNHTYNEVGGIDDEGEI